VKLGKLVGLIRIRAREQQIEAGLYLKGMAKLIEAGGRIKAHRIGKGMHPGADVRAHGFGASNLRRDEGGILAALDTDVGKLLTESYGL
jgi:hypothetical protein